MNTQFVGRSREISQIGEILNRAAHGVPGVVAVSSEAGSGKTRLIDESLRRVGNSSAVLNVSFSHEASAAGSSILDCFAATLADPFLASLPVAEELEELVTPSGKSHQARPRSHEALLAQLLQESASEQLTILRIEDLHWADASAVRLIDSLRPLFETRRRSEQLPQSQMAVLVTYRDLEIDETTAIALRQLVSVARGRLARLGPLTELEIDQLLRGYVNLAPSGPLLERIAEVTRGLPAAR